MAGNQARRLAGAPGRLARDALRGQGAPPRPRSLVLPLPPGLTGGQITSNVDACIIGSAGGSKIDASMTGSIGSGLGSSPGSGAGAGTIDSTARSAAGST